MYIVQPSTPACMRRAIHARSMRDPCAIHARNKVLRAYMHEHTCTSAYMQAYIHECMHACLYAYMHTCVYTYACMHAYMHAESLARTCGSNCCT